MKFSRRVLGSTWGERRGSNPRHLGPQPSALPAELRPPCAVQGLLYPFDSVVVELLSLLMKRAAR